MLDYRGRRVAATRYYRFEQVELPVGHCGLGVLV